MKLVIAQKGQQLKAKGRVMGRTRIRMHMTVDSW